MDIFNLYKKYGGKGYIGEEITQLEHATQCAFLAEEFCKNNDGSPNTAHTTNRVPCFLLNSKYKNIKNGKDILISKTEI